MKASIKHLAVMALLATPVLLLEGCGCGFDCNSDNDSTVTEPASLTLGLSDESLEQLKQVVIEVDSITFRRTGAEDVVVDTFSIEEQGLVAADSFQIDLLQYRGLNQLLVIEALELDATVYSDLLIGIIDDDINRSYVQESDDSLKPITVSGDVLSLPGMALSSGAQQFTAVFSLAQALQYQDATSDYLLTAEGIRVMDNAVSASLSGRVDRTLFDTVTPCDAKSDPESGNRVYIYAGTNLSTDQLADVFTDDSATAVPANAVAPFAVASLVEDLLTSSWQYVFGFMPAGDYSLAFSCDTAGDDPVNYDGFVIPLPSAQVYDINLAEGEQAICDLADSASCS